MAYRQRIVLPVMVFAVALSAFFQNSGALLAAGNMVWSFSEANDPDNKGRMTARLSYAVPETDNVQVSGVCEARSSTDVTSAQLILGADIGNMEEDAAVDIRFSGGGQEHVVSGMVHGTKAEFGITGVRADIPVDDPLWSILTEKEAIDYLVPGFRAARLDLRDGHGEIGQFIEACRTYARQLSSDTTAQNSRDADGGGVSEKEAFEAAKELDTVEAWEAFLNNFPSGFRADLARAYVQRLGAAGAGPAQPASPPPATPPPATQNLLQPVDLGPGGAPWRNGSYELDDGNRRAFAAIVQGQGMQLIAYCQGTGRAARLGLMLRENPRGIYPDFDERLRQGLDAAPAFNPDFKQIVMRFSDGSEHPVTVRVFGLTGEMEITQSGAPHAPAGALTEALMAGRLVTIAAPPFVGSFQLDRSRDAMCSVLSRCGAPVSRCGGGAPPPRLSQPPPRRPVVVEPPRRPVVVRPRRPRPPDCPGDSVRNRRGVCVKENDPGFQQRPRPRPRPAGPRGPECPGDSVRNAQGVCVKENDPGRQAGQGRPGRNNNQGGQGRPSRNNNNNGCPPGQIRAGNVCVNLGPLINQLRNGNQTP